MSAPVKWRLVHAKRAKLLRNRGEDVRFYGLGPKGKHMFTWLPKW